MELQLVLQLVLQEKKNILPTSLSECVSRRQDGLYPICNYFASCKSFQLATLSRTAFKWVQVPYFLNQKGLEPARRQNTKAPSRSFSQVCLTDNNGIASLDRSLLSAFYSSKTSYALKTYFPISYRKASALRRSSREGRCNLRSLMLGHS